MGAKGAVAVTRPGPGRPVPSSGPPSPRGGGKGLWGPRRGGGRGCVGVGGVLLCVPCPVTGQSSWPHRRRPGARPRFLFQRPPGRGPSIPRGAGPAAGRGYRATWASRAPHRSGRAGKCREEPGLWGSAGKGRSASLSLTLGRLLRRWKPEIVGGGCSVRWWCWCSRCNLVLAEDAVKGGLTVEQALRNATSRMSNFYLIL